MERDMDASIIDQSYLLGETCLKRSSNNVVVEPTGYNPSKAHLIVTVLTETETATNSEIREHKLSVSFHPPTSFTLTTVFPSPGLLFSSFPPSGTPSSTLSPSRINIDTSTILPSSTTSSLSSGSSTSRTKIIAGVTTSVTVTIILGLIVFCMLRRKCRDRIARSVSVHGVPTSSDATSQRMPQPTRSSTTPQPFLDFPAMRSSSSSKRIITDRGRSWFTQKNQADIEQAVNHLRDLVPAEGNSSNSVDEGRRLRDTLDRLQALTGRFEREIRQLSVLAQSGQLSTENCLILEGMRDATDLMIPHGSSHDIAGPSVGSSSYPPSYRSLRS